MSSAPAPVFNPNYLDDDTITTALADGTHAPVLQAYFGGAAYTELTLLAQQALQAKSDPRALRVYVLPGLLGSKLGSVTVKQQALLWLDPAAVMNGKLLQLAIGKRRSIRPMGAMLTTYLKLKLTLRAAGLSVTLWPYDWRRSNAQLGHQLATDLLHDSASEIMLVAHSMGGLAARVALNYPAAAKVSRVVQLGTPNQGSFALLQTLRACYPTVRKLGALDQLHSAEQLTQQVFRGFYSFYEMLPDPAHTEGFNLFDVQHWPQDAFTPTAQRLLSAKRVLRTLAKADRRCHSIMGIGQTTATGVRRVANEFVFQVSNHGDGTVPLPLAHWPQAQHWYVQETHGLLPRNTQVCNAVVDLLREQTTSILPSHYHHAQQNIDQHRIVEYHESELRLLANCKVRWDKLPINERRELLEPVISPAFAAACSE